MSALLWLVVESFDQCITQADRLHIPANRTVIAILGHVLAQCFEGREDSFFPWPGRQRAPWRQDQRQMYHVSSRQGFLESLVEGLAFFHVSLPRTAQLKSFRYSFATWQCIQM